MHLHFQNGGKALLEICEMAIEKYTVQLLERVTEIQVSD